MSNKKADAIKWFAEKIKDTPNGKLWLASSGAIITGSPIGPTEYVQTIADNPDAKASSEIEDVLALKDVKINMGGNVSAFDNALVDLTLVVAWGPYNPAKSFG